MPKALDLWSRVLDLFGPSRVVRFGPDNTVSEVIDDPEALVPDELSIVTPEQFDRAFEEYNKTMPSTSPAIEERWPAVIPGIDRALYPALKVKCEEIRWSVVRWEAHVDSGRIQGEGDVVGRMIAARYPYLTERQRSAARTYASMANR
jgi:hypothetical protein